MTDRQPEAPARYQGKRPIVVEAIQWTGVNLDAIRAFAGDDGTSCPAGGDLSVWNNRAGDWKPVPSGHWVVRGPLGMLSEDFFPLAPDLFASFYEPAGESPVLSADEFEAVRVVAERLGIAGTLRALASLAVGDDTGQPPSGAHEKAQARPAPVSEEAVDAALAAAVEYQRTSRAIVWMSPSRGQVRAMLEAAAPVIAAAERERIRQMAIRNQAVCTGDEGTSCYFADLIGDEEEPS